MEASVDTLVYQLEDEDPVVRFQTLQKLRKIAAVERAHFPVRNPRRFLHCVRRRIIDDEPQNALEALRLVTDIMGVLGDNVDQILSSILPHLVASLPNKGGKALNARSGRHAGDDDEDDETSAHVALHEETFQVFRKYVVVSNDLKAVVELLMNMGLAHATAATREASILAIVRLLDERYARKTRGARANFKANRMDKALFVGLFQALVPVLEDDREDVVVVAEEALGRLYLYWGDGVDDLMQFLSSEDRKTLQLHQEHIDEFLEASCVTLESLATASSTNSSTSALRIPTPETSAPNSGTRQLSSASTAALHFGFVSAEILEALKTSTSNSNADWKRRSVAVEKLFSALKEVNPAVLQRSIDELEELFDIVVRLMQDADVHLVKRAIQITQLCFHKLSDADDDEHAGQESTASRSSPPQSAAFYMQKMVPHLVETAANFADDSEMEAQLYALFMQLFQNGSLSVARASQALLGSLQHRRLQVREEACKVWIVLLLVAEREGFNVSKVLSHNVLQVLGRLLGDSSARVKEVATDTGAVLATVTRQAAELADLVEENLDEYLVERVDMDAFRRRLRQKHLPMLLESGLLSLAQANVNKTKPASVRNSYGSSSSPSATTTGSGGMDRSLSSVSELHMLASREFAPALEHPAVLRQSRHLAPPTATESVRSSVVKNDMGRRTPTPERERGLGSTSRFGYQPSSVAKTPPSVASNGGSMSDRSYFMGGEAHAGADFKGQGSSSPSAEPVADKLSMLKKKATQLRKSSSSRQVHNASLADVDSSDVEVRKSSTTGYSSERTSNQPPVRSKTSPEHYGDRVERDYEEDAPVVSARRQRGEVSGATKQMTQIPVATEPSDSPQKIQMLQSSGAAGVPFEDRPIVSKYAATSKSQEFGDGGDTIPYDDRPIVSKSKAHSSPFKSASEQYLDSSSSEAGNNELEAPRKRAQPRVASAARKRPVEADFIEAHEQPPSGYDAAMNGNGGEENGVDTYVPSGKAAAARPISLATRKRLEAKAKQDMAQASTFPLRDSSGGHDAAENDDTKSPLPVLQKKASLIAMTKAGGGSDDAKQRLSGFGKQEPKYLELHEIKPLANPKQEVSKLLEKIRGTDWEATFDALSIVRRLAMHHPAFLEDKVHAATKEILGQVPNLRSTVSKNSLLALESMCAAFSKLMDPEVDTIIAVLIKRSADSNTFVCESATSSINSVILHCSASKVVNALAVHLGSKAVPLRREVARAMHTLIVSMADQVVGSKDLSTIMNIVGKCLEDSNNEVRDAAKQSILYLCYEQRIDAEKLKRLLPGGAKAKVDQVLRGSARYTPMAAATAVKAPAKPTARKDELPVSAAVAPQAAQTKAEQQSSNSRTGSSSSSSSSASSASSGAASRKASSSSASSSPASVVIDTATLERVQKSLESSNWKDRYDALQEATAFISSGSTARALTESGKVTALFDLIIKRMEDGNSKVNVFALECLEKMIPALGSSGMELVLSSFVPALAKNLAANNPKLSALTLAVVQVLCVHVDAKLLCQHFAAIARHANSRIKPLLLDTLDQLANKSDEKNQYALNRYVLPLALELVKEAKSDVKDANTRLLRSLYASLGPTMLQAVYKQSTSQQERISSILGISAFVKS